MLASSPEDRPDSGVINIVSGECYIKFLRFIVLRVCRCLVLSRVARGKVVVIGDRETLPLFKSAGFTTVEAYSQAQALNIISRLQSSGDIVLIVVLKHIIDSEDEFKAKTAGSRIPVFVLPTLWSPGEPLDVNKLLAKALGL